ncbi:HNH endonuclease [Burkholderia sp. Ac-20384]|uniref:HNH endonuclease n=1 Tax=Burkholderia sp. Ac-20384 TaxID=2703902 RepID=UPI00197FCD70|nr:HNH endonuclease [Burkholderia sp. Ac-20384]MBN3822322.1 HNH endonuclease [Burkholderia sp. Ac-20384]
MNPRNDLTREDVAKILIYDQETGVFTWRANYHKRRIGGVAGGVNNTGYRHIRIGSGRYLEHRLAWLLVHGELPAGMLDHINGNRLDNRIANLRLADCTQNAYNRKKKRDNTSGKKGVSVNQERHRARINVNGKTFHLGYFSTMEDADRAVRQARESMHGEFSSHG